ncbi:MAG TPA: glycosyltransferase family 4 protein [Gemmatimonadales bacterium]
MISTPFLPVPPRDYGGTELVVHELVDGLIERGHEVTLFATGDSHTRAELRALYPQSQWPPEMLTDLSHVTWAMGQVTRDFDVVHAHSAVALALRRLVSSPPLVYTLHHARDEQLSAFYGHCHDAHFVAISADQASREIPLPRCSVIHHGLDPARFTWSPRPADYVCFVGRLTEVKGPHTAIDISARAGVPIRIAGAIHPPDREFAKRELSWRFGLSYVSYLGSIGMKVKLPLLRDARALLAPIDWNEPFGLILIEAMLSGCPVVAFARGSVPELVEPGVTGFIVGSAEEMVELIRPGGGVERFDRERCWKRAVERFSRDRMVVEYERLYARTARGTPSRQRALPSRVA